VICVCGLTERIQPRKDELLALVTERIRDLNANDVSSAEDKPIA